ncbi:MAG: four helix bundle protein [Isosphaeraceae bacterium]
MSVRHYQELIVWQKAMDLVLLVYGATSGFPQKEVFGLTNQLRRAAVSIPSNIAEGQGRKTTRDFVHYLSISNGSLQELETQVILASRLNYIDEVQQTEILDRSAEVGRLINGLKKSLTKDDRN